MNTSRGQTMLATVLRGLRSRALLTVGSVLLTALAIGAAVLGPIFQVAVTNSYYVTRLEEAPNLLTGLTWNYQPAATYDGTAATARDQAARVVDARETGPFAAARPQLVTDRFEALKGEAQLLAREDACIHLEIEGRCPTGPDEVLMLVGDLDFTGLQIGDKAGLGPAGTKTVVGAYRLPESEADFWYDPQRLASVPRTFDEVTLEVTPYEPAPLIVTPEAFDELPASLWEVLVDRRLDVPPDTTTEDLRQAMAAAARLEGPPEPVSGGTLVGDSINDLPAIAAETRQEQQIARASIAPAVFALVLVALALLLRLLMSAAELRLPELALASLRGLPRRRMWGLGLSEPIAVLALSVPVGVVTGLALSLVLVRWWLVPGLPLPIPWESGVAALLVLVAAFGVSVLAVGLVLRSSLSEQLTGVRRPRATGRVGLVIQLALVATALSVLAAKLSVSEPGRPDATDLILPVLLAVVAGLAATHVTARLAGWWTRARSRTRSLPAFVAARAISRRMEGTLVILPVTAAIAVCVFGAGVHESAAQWRASVAATTAPAGEVWSSPLTFDETVELTHELDPEGSSLMAATTISTLGPTYVVLDSPRLAQVGVWPDQWTPGAGAAQVADELSLDAAVPTFTGRRVAITLDNRAEVDGELHVGLQLVRLGESAHQVFLGPFPEGRSTRSVVVPFCRGGCRLDAINLGGPATTRTGLNGVIRVTGISVDGQRLEGGIEGAGWDVAPDASDAEMVRSVRSQAGTIAVDVGSGESDAVVQLAAGALTGGLPVVRGVDAPASRPRGSFGETSATEFETRAALVGQSVPFLGPSGSMIDYSTLTTDRVIYQQRAPVYVLARTDSPDNVTQALRDRGLSVSTTLADVERTLDQGAYALALRLYAVVALLVLLMALAGLFVSTAVQMPARRRDAASLRVVGVPRRSVMSAVVRELAVVLGGTAIAGLAAGTLAQYVVLRTVTLGVVESITTPALVAAVDWGRLVLLTAAAVVLFGTVALVSAALTVRGARGSTLRESAR
ncbi:MAG: FtsX-like permease family protein [Nocardioides sp.]